MTNELQIMIDSMQKKVKVLQQILEKSIEQYELVKEEKIDLEKFDHLVDEKDALLNEMNLLDEGFEYFFKRIKDTLPQQKQQYKEQIVFLQKLIEKVTDQGAQIYTTEKRTKDKLSVVLENHKKQLTQKKTSMKSVMDYYKMSNNLLYVDPYFMDQKK